MVLEACFCFTPQRIGKKRKEEKMDARMNTSVAALVLLVLISYGGRGGEAQECLPSLTPCASYLNTTGTPDKTCCDGLINVIDKDAKCLCGLLNNSAVKQMGINMTKALELPARCGKNVTADQCTKINSSGGAPSATPASTPMPTSGGSSTPGISPSSSPMGDSSTPAISPSSSLQGDSSTPGASPSSSSKGDSSGASSLAAALFSSVSLAALFSLELASHMLMEGGGGL